MLASAECLITIEQIAQLCPASITYKGRTFRAVRYLYENETDTVNADFQPARRRRGAYLKDKIRLIVSLEPSDTYAVRVVYFDGVTLDDEPLCEPANGVYFDSLSTVLLSAVRGA